jgi:2-furoyl-CoA dehydrogenase large subunit
MLLDPEILSSVMPGCRELTEAADHNYRGVMNLGVGPVSGQFEARISLSDLCESESLTLNGALTGPLGSSHGTGWVTLEPQQDGTLLRYRYEIHLAGKVAAVGGRMLNGATRTLFAQFFKALGRHAEAQASPDQPAPPGKKSWRERLRLKS